MEGAGLLDAIPKIRVVIRKRPLGSKEIAKKDKDIVQIKDGNTVIVRELRYESFEPEPRST